MTDRQCQSIAVFFRLSLLNPRIAEQAAIQAFRSLEKTTRSQLRMPSLDNGKDFDTHFVRVTSKLYRRVRSAALKEKSLFSHPIEISGLDLSPWRDFILHSPEEEILTLIWVQILQMPIKAVAIGGVVTEGTVRHRLSRAARKLSTKLDPVEVTSLQPRRPWK